MLIFITDHNSLNTRTQYNFLDSRRFNKKNKDKNQTNENNVSSNNQANNVSNGNAQANSQAKLSEEADLDLSGFASETTEREVREK